jgi:F-type H+-transporting ATPase subunit b
MVAVFTDRLRSLGETTKSQLGEALKSSAEPALVRSAFELGDEPRGAIQNAVNETFSADIKLNFESRPDLVSGIELTASGKRVAWSIADYLRSLETGVAELLKAKAGA